MKLTNTEELLIELLNVPSESGNEVALAELLAEKLANQFSVEKIPVADDRFDVLATVGTPKTLLVAHIDTVPGQLEVRADEENIYGRGSCDNKGAAAAMVGAAEQALAQGQTDFGLLFTVGEETSCDGAEAAVKILKEKQLAPKLIVIGEPTGLEIVTAQKGILAGVISCGGARAHSSLAERDSATEKLVRILNQLMTTCPPDTLFNIGELSGGEAENIVADKASAKVSWRTSQPNFQKRVEQVVAELGVECRIDFFTEMQPVDRTQPSFARNEVAYFSEMFFFENSILLGPGDIKNAHTDSEFVPRAELNAVVERYLDLLARSQSTL